MMITTLFTFFEHLAELLILGLTLPGTLELFILTLAAILPKKSLITTRVIHSSALPKLVIVIPAYNESEGITECIVNVKASVSKTHACDVVVIADNCFDDTAKKAIKAGARVLVRQDEIKRGKGYALDYAFKILLSEHFDYFLVIDADSRIDEDVISEFQYAFAQGFDALQCRYRIANPDQSPRARLQYIAWLAFNELRLLGREKLNLSVGILGNGFVLSRHVLETVPYEASSIAEDMEYHLSLVAAGFKVHFLDTACVYSDAPNQNNNAAQQRTRWEGGRFRLLIDRVPLLCLAVLRGKWNLLEPLFELLLLPLAYHVLLLLLTLLLPVAILQWYAGISLLLVFLHVLIAILIAGGGLKEFKVLATVPLYMLWKITLLPRLWMNSRRNTAWERTDRENE